MGLAGTSDEVWKMARDQGIATGAFSGSWEWVAYMPPAASGLENLPPVIFPKLRPIARGSRPLEVGSGCFCLGDSHGLPVAGAERWHRLCFHGGGTRGAQRGHRDSGHWKVKSMLAPERSQPTVHYHSDPGRKIFID